MNNHQQPTFHPLGDFLNPALALLGQGLKKYYFPLIKVTAELYTKYIYKQTKFK
jgi:hypothetical protein